MAVFEVRSLPSELEAKLGSYTQEARTAAAHFCHLAQPAVREVLEFATERSFDSIHYAIRLLESYAVRQINKNNTVALPVCDIQFLKDCIVRGWPRV